MGSPGPLSWGPITYSWHTAVHDPGWLAKTVCSLFDFLKIAPNTKLLSMVCCRALWILQEQKNLLLGGKAQYTAEHFWRKKASHQHPGREQWGAHRRHQAATAPSSSKGQSSCLHILHRDYKKYRYRCML